MRLPGSRKYKGDHPTGASQWTAIEEEADTVKDTLNSQTGLTGGNRPAEAMEGNIKSRIFLYFINIIKDM